MRKETRKYYFSVEGETEQWYLQWLQKQINATDSSAYLVSFDCKVEKDPIKRVKSMTVAYKTDIVHLVDYESNEEIHTIQFQKTLDKMKTAQSLGKTIKYHLGYSNFTFDLWIILHQADCNQSYINRSQYLRCINDAFGESFLSMGEYKHEGNFKRLLSGMTINNVYDAVHRGATITLRNKENGCVLNQYKGFNYYRENPSLSICDSIENILKECQLL